MLARIVKPTSGQLFLDGKEIPVGARRTLAYTSEVQLVLQDPFASNNPVHRVRHSLERPLLIHGADKSDVEELAKAALARVSLDPPEKFMDRYPTSYPVVSSNAFPSPERCAFDRAFSSQMSRSPCSTSRCAWAY